MIITIIVSRITSSRISTLSVIIPPLAEITTQITRTLNIYNHSHRHHNQHQPYHQHHHNYHYVRVPLLLLAVSPPKPEPWVSRASTVSKSRIKVIDTTRIGTTNISITSIGFIGIGINNISVTMKDV